MISDSLTPFNKSILGFAGTLSGWLALLFANQPCGILMRELTASNSACVPLNRSLSSHSHLHGRRLCFVGKDFHNMSLIMPFHPTPMQSPIFHLSDIFILTLKYIHDHNHTQIHRQPHKATIIPVWSSAPTKKRCNIINKIMVFKWHVCPPHFC